MYLTVRSDDEKDSDEEQVKGYGDHGEGKVDDEGEDKDDDRGLQEEHDENRVVESAGGVAGVLRVRVVQAKLWYATVDLWMGIT